MADSLCVDTTGFNLLNDPKFWEAYRYNAPTQTSVQDTASVTDTASVKHPSFQGGAAAVEELDTQNKSSFGKIATSVIFTGVAGLCLYATHKGNGKGLAKMVDGFKQLGNLVGEKLGIVKTGLPRKFTIRKDGTNTVCTLPNRKNIMRGNTTAASLDSLSVQTAAPDISGAIPATIKAKVYQFTDNGFIYTVRKGKVRKVTDTAGTIQEIPKELPKEITEKIAKFEKGENWNELQNLEFAHCENGTARLFTRQNPTDTPELKCAVSERFNSKSDAVKAYLEKNSKAKAKLEAFEKGETKDLGIVSAEYEVPSIGGTFIIKDNKITGIKIGDTFHSISSDKYISLKGDNKELFDKIFENKDSFTNVIYK